MTNNNKNKSERINRLLEMAWGAHDDESALNYAGQILEIDPENPDALIIQADLTPNDQERLKILERALKSAENISGPGSDKDFTIFVLNHRVALTSISCGDINRACEAVLKLVELEKFDDFGTGRELYYRVLIYKSEWQKILTETMRDNNHQLAWGYSRLLATFMLSRNLKFCSKMFWDALIISPDAPFYMLGYFEEPDEDSSDEAKRAFNFALLFHDIFSVSEEFFMWFSRGVLLFGLLSGRLNNDFGTYGEDDGSESAIEILNTLGGLEEYNKMKKLITENDDRAIIEMLAAHKCLSN